MSDWCSGFRGLLAEQTEVNRSAAEIPTFCATVVIPTKRQLAQGAFISKFSKNGDVSDGVS